MTTLRSKPKCTIRLIDEVYAVVGGVSQTTLEFLSDRYAVFAANHFFHPKFKLGTWDGKLRFFTATGLTYINLLPDIVEFVLRSGYSIDIVDERNPVNREPRFVTENEFAHIETSRGPFMLRDYQCDAVNSVLQDGGGLIEASTSSGKAQPLTSKVLTTIGWKCMGDIELNDRVITPSGRIANIAGIFPQGTRPVYEISFHDGTSARCDIDHLWEVYIPSRGTVVRTKRVMSTSELIDWRAQGIRGTAAVRVCSPVTFSNQTEVTIPGYLLGCLLGDSGLSQSNAIKFTSADKEIVDRLSGLCRTFGVDLKYEQGYDYRISKIGVHAAGPNRLTVALREYGLMGTSSETKFIPEQYKFASIDERLSLLRGIMDTDGTVGKNHDCSLTTISKRLAEDVAEIARSLGMIASIKLQKPRYYNHRGERRMGKQSYRVTISTMYPKELFTLTRKQDKCPEIRNRGTMLCKRIIDIKYIHDEPTQCIMVDDPDHLYITDEYTVTHNTAICAALSRPFIELGYSVIIIVPSTSLVLQTIETFDMLNIDVGQYSGSKKDLDHSVIISTWQALQNNKDIVKKFQVLIVDEVHLAKGKVLNELITKYGNNIPFRFGMTGTIPKDSGDAMTIRVALGEVKYIIPAAELIDQEYLSTLQIDVLMLHENHPEDYFPSYHAERNYLYRKPERLEWIAELIVSKSTEDLGNCFVLVPSVAMGRALQKLIAGSTFICGDTDAVVRKRDYDLFATENNKVTIATVHVAGTGLSIDRIFHLFYIDIGKSFTRVIQAVGRGLRKGGDKEHINVYDICSNLKYSKRHLQHRLVFYKEAQYPFKKRTVKYRLYSDTDWSLVDPSYINDTEEINDLLGM